MFLTSNVYNMYMEVVKCNWHVESPIDYFLSKNFGFIFENVPYNRYYAMSIYFFNLCLTLNWNYMDLFLMLISMGLATRFRQINTKLEEFRGKVCSRQIFSGKIFNFFFAKDSGRD